MIVILSPQSWEHQFVSKHHYAVEFSKQHKTVFVSPTQCKLARFSFRLEKNDTYDSNLFNAQLVLPIPDWCRFKFNSIFQKINRVALSFLFRKTLSDQIRLLIDFGCHKSIDRLDRFNSLKTIYFPVDDHIDLPIKTRRAYKLFTVSSRIQEKFEQKGIPISWINHGLSSVFAKKAKAKLIELEQTKANLVLDRKTVGYAGNLSIPFLDRAVVVDTIEALPDMEFHFFGSHASSDEAANKFINRLKAFKNVKLHGQLSTDFLAAQLFETDILWLCYKADGKNYHLENSHKILEYLSTGKPFVSSPIKYLQNAEGDLLYQYKNEKHSNVIKTLKHKEDSLNIIKQRIKFATKSTYQENIKILMNC